MTTYNYKALAADGKVVKGVLEGDSERQVRSQLRARQMRPVEVTANSGGRERSTDKTPRWRLFSPRVSQADLTLITRQLATLVQSNMPLDEVLTAVAQQSRRPRLKALMLQVRSRVVEGHSLAYALGDFPGVFNEMYRSMVKAGESAGFLGTVLDQLADYTENRQYTQQKLKMAMIYPAILLVVAVLVIAVLMIFVVPKLVGLFAHSKVELPALTRYLIASSDFVAAYWWVVLTAVVLLVIGFRQWLKSPLRRALWHRLLLRLPVFSGFFTAMDTARFASTLSILVSSGVPLLDGLRIAGEVMTNLRLREACATVATTVAEGSSLNRALAAADVFPPMMVHMVASGEASGALENMLDRAARNQERELDMTLSTVMGLMEPLMLVIMAAIVGTIVIAVLLPIVQMNNLVT